MAGLVAQTIDGVETVFTWDQALELPQVLATSDGARDLYGVGRIGIVQAGAWKYSLADALGSVRAWADPSGALLSAQSYGPFGEAREPVGTPPWGYTGEWQDPAGMVYLRARWYNGALGRFTQVDPFPGLPSVPGTLHPYAYVLNDPLNLTDPGGDIAPWLAAMAASVAIGAGIGAIGGGISYVAAHPGRSLSEYVQDRTFWRSVGVGAASGAVSGFVGWSLPALLPTTSLWGALGVGAVTGALSSGAGQLTTNALMGCAWDTDLGSAMVAGGITGSLAAGFGHWLRSRNIVYRNPNSSEHPSALTEGFRAKAPNATYKPNVHVTRGSNMKTQYISTTRSLAVARLNQQDAPIYKIDLLRVEGDIIDLSQPAVRDAVLKFSMAANFARKSAEVLIKGEIPPEAILGVIR